VPTRYEMQEFLDAVDGLRDDVERLAARVERVKARQGGAGETK
jgi:ubiquinone biosynthesis protein UbiJ